jgi:molybdopterin molybdotransferase
VIPLDEARSVVLGTVGPLASRACPLEEASGRVLAVDVRAPHPLPRFDNSAMDGFALRAGDTAHPPTRLAVVGSIMAGQTGSPTVQAGQAVRIMTGAPMPDGADAVCMIELVREEAGGAEIVLEAALTIGTHLRKAGSDLAEGDLVVAAGTTLTPAHVGVLASLGFEGVTVVGTPRVAVVSTGDELTSDPEPLPRGRIRDANRPALLAQLRRDGFEPHDVGIVPDDEDAVLQTLHDATATCDAIVVSGGVSVGDRDVMRLVLDKLGEGAMRWMQVAIKPAKPFAFGTLAPSGTPLFALPGNPVSALVSYELFVRPALRAMAGLGNLDRPRVWATAHEPLRRVSDGKVHFQRVRVWRTEDGGIHTASSGGQESHMLHGMAGATGLALLPDGPALETGARVEVLLLDADALAQPGAEQAW